MAIDYLPVSWSEYHTLARQLADSILTDRVKIDEIVAISRGGLTLGHLLTDLLRVPISTFTIQSYSDLQTKGKVRITKPLTIPLDGKNILLVDDVSDTGTTLKRAIEYLNMLTPQKITTLTMYYKPHSIYKPDYFARTTSAWIMFPYEPTETIINLAKSMQEEKKTEKEIETFLLSQQFSKEHIAFVKKFYLQ